MPLQTFQREHRSGINSDLALSIRTAHETSAAEGRLRAAAATHLKNLSNKVLGDHFSGSMRMLHAVLAWLGCLVAVHCQEGPESENQVRTCRSKMLGMMPRHLLQQQLIVPTIP
eukprot:932771-Pelagomonas_calceolata.AAC.9